MVLDTSIERPAAVPKKVFFRFFYETSVPYLKSFSLFLNFPWKTMPRSYIFQKFKLCSLKGVPYKPYWVYCSSCTVRPRIRTSKNLDKMSPNYQYLFNGLTPKVNQRHLLSYCGSNFVPELIKEYLKYTTSFYLYYFEVCMKDTKD